MSKKTFVAYNHGGNAVASSWTSAPGPEAAERSAYQSLLNQGRYLKVVITSSDPKDRVEELLPRREK